MIATLKRMTDRKKRLGAMVGLVLLWLLLGIVFKGESILVASLQTGLLDPLPLLYRSVNLALLPLVNRIFT